MSISKFLMPMISFFLFLVAGVGVAVASALRCCYSPHLIAISATPEMNRIDMMALAVNVLLRNLDIKWVMLIAFYGLWYKCWSYWIRFFFLRLYACNCENKSVLHECGKAIQLCYPIDFFFSLYSDWGSQQEYMGEKIDVISLCWLYEYIIFSVIPVILCAEAICGVNGWEYEWFLPLQRILAQLPLWWSGFVWTINVKGGICHRNSWLNTLARSQPGKHMSNCIITSNISMNRNPLFQRFLLTTFLFKKQYWKFQLKTTTTNM